LLLAATLIVASAAAVAGEVEDKLRAALGERLPGITIESITKLPQLDLYEVVSNGNRIFYTDAKGEFARSRSCIPMCRARRGQCGARQIRERPGML
jgi:hypothetical protein